MEELKGRKFIVVIAGVFSPYQIIKEAYYQTYSVVLRKQLFYRKEVIVISNKGRTYKLSEIFLKP